MYNSYYIHPKTAFKHKHTACSIIAVLAFFALIGTGTDDLTTFIVKNSLCVAVMAIAAIIGDLNSIKEDKDEL